jgi:hypothetical protein
MVSACECMEVKWTTDKILPGKQGRVEVVFNTLSFKGDVSWDIDVVFKNTDTDGFPLTKSCSDGSEKSDNHEKIR